MGFMVFKTTGLSSLSQRKNRFWKIYTGSRDIDQNIPKYEGLVWLPEFRHKLFNISGPGAYFSKPIFALKPWAQAGRFEYHKPYKWNKIEIWIIRGLQIFKGIWGWSKSTLIFLKIQVNVLYIFNNDIQPCKKWNCDFFGFWSTLRVHGAWFGLRPS